MNSFDIARFDEMVERTVLLKHRVADQEVTIELLRIMVETLRESLHSLVVPSECPRRSPPKLS